MGQQRRTGDDDFEAFYRRTFGHVWTVLGRAGIHRRAERDELAQDVYLVAHEKRARRKRSAPELAWIGCIARRTAWRFRALARTQKEEPVDEPDGVSQPIASGLSPEDAALCRGQYHEVMESLDENHREVFEMHRVEGFTIDEIAATLERPAGTVSTWLRQAQERVDAAVTRIQAREARAGHMALVPLAVGDWRGIGRLFDGPPPGMEEQVWSGVCRGIARAALIGGGTAAAGAVAGKAVAFGSGLLVGGGAVGAAFALHLLGAPHEAPTSISRAPEVTSVALAPTESATPSATPGAQTPAQAAASGSTANTQAPTSVATLDPEEERILARAEAAYARGNIDAAKAALAEHARRFPHGVLKAERERLRAKFDASKQPSAADGGRAPHRLMGTDEE